VVRAGEKPALTRLAETLEDDEMFALNFLLQIFWEDMYPEYMPDLRLILLLLELDFYLPASADGWPAHLVSSHSTINRVPRAFRPWPMLISSTSVGLGESASERGLASAHTPTVQIETRSWRGLTLPEESNKSLRRQDSCIGDNRKRSIHAYGLGYRSA